MDLHFCFCDLLQVDLFLSALECVMINVWCCPSSQDRSSVISLSGLCLSVVAFTHMLAFPSGQQQLSWFVCVFFLRFPTKSLFGAQPWIISFLNSLLTNLVPALLNTHWFSCLPSPSSRSFQPRWRPKSLACWRISAANLTQPLQASANLSFNKPEEFISSGFSECDLYFLYIFIYWV